MMKEMMNLKITYSIFLIPYHKCSEFFSTCGFSWFHGTGPEHVEHYQKVQQLGLEACALSWAIFMESWPGSRNSIHK